MHRPGRRPPAVVTAVVAAATAVLVAGCGAPDYRFVSSDERDVVLKVPRDWTRIDAEDVVAADGAEGRQQLEGRWVTFYDAAARPSAKNVRSESVDQPVLIAQSFPLGEQLKGSVTDDQLRNAFKPVTEQARALTTGGADGDDFRLLHEEVVRTPTARGIRETFVIDEGDGPEVYAQVALTDPGRTRVHLLLVHCSEQCYRANRPAIAEVYRSFTVKPA